MRVRNDRRLREKTQVWPVLLVHPRPLHLDAVQGEPVVAAVVERDAVPAPAAAALDVRDRARHPVRGHVRRAAEVQLRALRPRVCVYADAQTHERARFLFEVFAAFREVDVEVDRESRERGLPSRAFRFLQPRANDRFGLRVVPALLRRATRDDLDLDPVVVEPRPEERLHLFRLLGGVAALAGFWRLRLKLRVDDADGRLPLLRLRHPAVRFPAVRLEQPSVLLPRGGGFRLALAARADAVNHVIPRAENPFDVPAQNLDVGEVRQRRLRFRWLFRRGQSFERLALELVVLHLDLALDLRRRRVDVHRAAADERRRRLARARLLRDHRPHGGIVRLLGQPLRRRRRRRRRRRLRRLRRGLGFRVDRRLDRFSRRRRGRFLLDDHLLRGDGDGDRRRGRGRVVFGLFRLLVRLFRLLRLLPAGLRHGLFCRLRPRALRRRLVV
mmetsp:Transcript_11775/g.42438  ORF Transcript_11775/g.42438 Transcript_11775/m.42438 type:complete len:443 (-) Transcript_11775:1283-2611(-)